MRGMKMSVKIKRRYYVKFYYPGTFFAETTTIESFREKTIKQILKLKEAKGAFAFDKSEQEFLIKNGQIFKGDSFNNSIRYYIDAELLTPTELELKYPNADTLIWNVKINKWESVLKLNCGWFWPFEVNNVLIKSEDFKCQNMRK
jgi:hypothetical protein